MGIGVTDGERYWAIGAPSFFNAFFSTVYVRLENENWGARFPTVMNELYSGTVKRSALSALRQEFASIKAELSLLPPGAVVWDFEDRTALPPWAGDSNEHITSLANYFVTSDGEDLLGVLEEASLVAERARVDLRVE